MQHILTCIILFLVSGFRTRLRYLSSCLATGLEAMARNDTSRCTRRSVNVLMHGKYAQVKCRECGLVIGEVCQVNNKPEKLIKTDNWNNKAFANRDPVCGDCAITGKGKCMRLCELKAWAKNNAQSDAWLLRFMMYRLEERGIVKGSLEGHLGTHSERTWRPVE